jgi:hypothetical protein
MKYCWIFLFAFCFVRTLIADDYSDFRIPRHRVFGLTGQLGAATRIPRATTIISKHEIGAVGAILLLTECT